LLPRRSPWLCTRGYLVRRPSRELGTVSDFVGGSYDGSAAARTFFSSSLASGAYVLCLFIAPCNCDSDERLDCCWSPVVVAVDVVSTVSVVDLLSR
jgi:hypothetical protein